MTKTILKYVGIPLALYALASMAFFPFSAQVQLGSIAIGAITENDPALVADLKAVADKIATGEAVARRLKSDGFQKHIADLGRRQDAVLKEFSEIHASLTPIQSKAQQIEQFATSLSTALGTLERDKNGTYVAKIEKA